MICHAQLINNFALSILLPNIIYRYYSQSKYTWTTHLRPNTVDCASICASPRATFHAQMLLL